MKIDSVRKKIKRTFIPIIFLKPIVRKNKGKNHEAKENKSIMINPKPLNTKYNADSVPKVSK